MLFVSGDQWKIGKVAELSPSKLCNLLYCTTCGQHYLYSGDHIKITERIRGGWQCQKCKTCQNCRQAGNEDRYLLCDVCDGAYHAYCLRPQMSSVPKNGWKCKRCRRCTDCNSKTPGSGQSSRWHNNYSVCDSCYQQRNKGLACPLCGRAYRHSAQREMIQCSSCRKHVHSACDPEATEEKILERRALQYNYMYVCKICKGQQQVKGPGANAGTSMAAPLSRAYDDPSTLETVEDPAGAGRGKPANVNESKKKLFASAASRAKPGYTWSAQQGLPGPNMDLTSSIAEKKKRVAEIRARRGRTPKYKGMVGLSKPQGDPSMKEDDVQEENKMIICSVNDDFVLKQDMCSMCGSLGNDLEGRLICCAQCGQCYHPHCVNVKVTKIILQKGWRCLDCTVCEGCGKKHDEANLILCDDCDISYHIYCTDPPLEQVPDGAWKCKWCSVCQYCGTNTPGINCNWFDNYSTCGPCHSLQQCPLCEEGYEDGELIVTCSTCTRWCHAECDNIQNEEEAEKCFEAGYMCQLCRPDNSLPPHLADRADDDHDHLPTRKALHRPPSPPMSPDYPAYGGFYSNASYMLDGVMLSERGMQHLKSLTIEKDKRMRKRRLGPDTFNPLDPAGGSSHDNSLEGEEDEDDEAPPATPGVSAMSGNHKDGEIVKPLPDGSAPEPPEGFTIVVKDNGLMVLRKRRYRDLKKVGIGGFQAKVRTPKGPAKGKEEEVDDNDPNKPKKRVAWRPKKNKILVQYPEYIQDAFFGKDFMAKCPDKMDDEEVLPSPDKKRLQSADDGKAVHLNKDALAALEEMKAKEEAERKEREAEEEKARAAMEAAAKVAADKARIAQEELEALNQEAQKEEGETSSKKSAKEEEKTEDEDLMLPSDLFGDVDIFNIFKGTDDGTGIDIDDSVLDEAEEVDGNNETQQPTEQKVDVNKELTEGLQDMLGPDFNVKDVEDIFNIAATDTNKGPELKPELKAEDIKSEPGEAAPSTAVSSAPAQTENANIPISVSSIKTEIQPPVSQDQKPPVNSPMAAPGAGGNFALDQSQGGDSGPGQVGQAMMNSTETFSGQMMVPRLATSVQSQPPQASVQNQQNSPALPSGMQASTPSMQMSTPSMQMSTPSMQMSTPNMQMSTPNMQMSTPSMQMSTPSMQMSTPSMQMSTPVMRQNPPAQVHNQPNMMENTAGNSQMLTGNPGAGMQMSTQNMQQMPNTMQQSQMPQMQTTMTPQIQGGQMQMQQLLQQQRMMGMGQQIIQQGRPMVQQQQQPASVSVPQHQLQGMRQQGFIRQPGHMMQQQQQQVVMPGQRVVMQQLPNGQIIQRGQLVGQGGQIIRQLQPGVPMQPQQPQQVQHQPQPQPQQPQQVVIQPGHSVPAAATNTPAPKESAQQNMQKWEADEPQGENATIAMILYANINHTNLKMEYPKWEDRIKQIAKIWKNLPNEKRVPYVTKARENRTANRSRGPVSIIFIIRHQSPVR